MCTLEEKFKDVQYCGKPPEQAVLQQDSCSHQGECLAHCGTAALGLPELMPAPPPHAPAQQPVRTYKVCSD